MPVPQTRLGKGGTRIVKDFLVRESRQFLILMALCSGVILQISFYDAHIYQQFLGAVDPLMIFAVVSLLGVVLLAPLLKQDLSAIRRIGKG